MIIPNVLSASGVPHNLRAMALVPALHIVAALGIVGAVEVGRRVLRTEARSLFLFFLRVLRVSLVFPSLPPSPPRL